MATGGIFTLVTNDGKQDRMLMATALLSERLRAIHEQKRLALPGLDPRDSRYLPTLLDIEKTHVLFTNAHFKPFAAIGFEYNKVRASSGNPTLGSTVQFSIPQFGDFFHDIACRAVLAQPTLAATATGSSDQPLMRWCHFPGERLLKRVVQEVNGNPLDEYTYHATNCHREYRVAPNKRLAWDRAVGQEVPEEGFLSQPNWAASGVAPASITHRVKSQVCTGNQTPTAQKSGSLELFIPLLFWYNKDVRLAVPSVAIPFGQRFINLELASFAEMCGMYPRGASTFASPGGTLTEPSAGTLSSIELYINNIFVNPDVHQIYIRRIGFSLIRVHRQQLYNANTSSQEVLLNNMKWPIEYLFVGMKIKDYHAGSTDTLKRTHLDKWHTFHQRGTGTYNTTGQSVYKEVAIVTDGGTLGIAISNGEAVVALTGTGTLAVAVAAGDLLVVDGLLVTVTTGAAAAAAVTGVSVARNNGPAVTASAGIATAARKLVRQGLQVETDTCTRTMTELTVKAHGISIYDRFPFAFFNGYAPYHYGGVQLNTPEDCGLAFVPFCLFPGTYQPSGHINVSRAREFYLNYESTVIDNSTEGTLVIIASAINFLLISDGSAVLRYST